MADPEFDPDVVDDKIEAERQWIITATPRRIAGRLEAMSPEDVIPIFLPARRWFVVRGAMPNAEAVVQVPSDSRPR